MALSASGFSNFSFDDIISTMKEIFGKQVNAFLALLAFQILVIFVVVVETFGNSGGPIQALYDLISKSPGLLGIFDTIADYSSALSGMVVCIALVILLFNLRKYQRDRAVIRLHNWARNGVVALAQYRQENAGTTEGDPENLNGVKNILDKMNSGLGVVNTDARILGGELNNKIQKTIGVLHTIEDKLGNRDNSLSEDLQNLQHDLADIMIRAFEIFK
jgi:hypothetical protein